MSITFGAVGDIISTVQIAVQLLTALNESRGSAREFRELVAALEGFRGLLEQLVTIWPTRSECPQLESLRQTFLPVVRECGEEISGFLDVIIKKYGRSLGKREGRGGNRLKDMGRMIQWHVFEGDSVDRLKGKLDGSQRMISLAFMAAQGVAEEKDQSIVRERLDFIRDQQIKADCDLDERLDGIHSELILQSSKLDELSEEFRRMLSLISPIAETSLNIKSTNMELLQLMQKVYETQITRSSIPASPDIYKDNSVILEDALGYSLRIPLETVRSWTVVKQILIDNFADRRGSHLVKSGRYILQDSVTNRDLSLAIPFHQATRPGQKISMAMFFYNTDGNAKANACPRCATITLSSGDQDINCSNTSCDVTFRHVIKNPEIFDIDANSTALTTFTDDLPAVELFEDSNISKEAITYLTKPTREDDSPDVFKRVRLFTRWQDSIESRGPKYADFGLASFWHISDQLDNMCTLFWSALIDNVDDIKRSARHVEGPNDWKYVYYIIGFLGKGKEQAKPIVLVYSKKRNLREREVEVMRRDPWLRGNGVAVAACSGKLWRDYMLWEDGEELLNSAENWKDYL